MRCSPSALGLSAEGLRTNLNASIALAAIKLVIMPLIVYGLCLVTNLDPLYTIAAVDLRRRADSRRRCSSWPAQYKVEEELVASTVSITTLLSVATLMGWLYALSGLSAQVQRTAQVNLNGRIAPQATKRRTYDLCCQPMLLPAAGVIKPSIELVHGICCGACVWHNTEGR